MAWRKYEMAKAWRKYRKEKRSGVMASKISEMASMRMAGEEKSMKMA
jgi:hypothetical protein